MTWKNSYHKTGRYFSEIGLNLAYIIENDVEKLIITAPVKDGKAKSPLRRICEGHAERELECWRQIDATETES